VLDAAIEEGCTFWDTADVYGDSEDLLGKWYASNSPVLQASLYFLVYLKVQEDGKEEPDIPCYQIWFDAIRINS